MYHAIWIGVVAGLLMVQAATAQSHFTSCAVNTGTDATVIVPTSVGPTINERPMEAGDELAVFTPEGLCAGVLVWEEKDGAFTIWGDNSQTDVKDGLDHDDPLAYRVWDASAKREYDSDQVEVTYSGSESFYRTKGTFASGAIYALASLTVLGPPLTPTPSSPSNGDTDIPRDTRLNWKEADGATSYTVEIALSSSFNTVIARQEEITTTTYQANGLAYNTTYYWRVRAVGPGGTSSWSAAWGFTVEAEPPPAAPLLVSPQRDSTGLETDVMFSWNAVAGASSYRIQLSEDADFGTPFYEQGRLATTSTEVAALAHATTYYWRVRASGPGGTGPWSDARSFTTRSAPPSAPALQSPAHDADDQARRPTLSWATVTQAASYHVQVATTSAFSTLVAEDTARTATTFRPPTLAYGTTYHWRVRARGPTGTSAWSSARRFTVQEAPQPPTAPALVAPTPGATDQPLALTLTWRAADRAQSYTLQVATTADFSTLILERDALSDTSFAASDLDHSTTYHWRVRATGAGGTGAWSTTHQFSTQPAPPAAPLLTIPTDDATNQSTSPTLAWSTVSGAATYTLQLATDAGFANLVMEQNLAETSFDAGGLGYSTNYYWRVRAAGSGGTGDWSATYRFSTRPAPPAAPLLDAPIDEATSQPTSLELAWNAVSGASTYTIQLASTSDFSSIITQEDLAGTSFAASDLDHSTTYHWRVRATGDGGTGAWSTARSFSTRPAPPATPLLASPADGVAAQSTSLELAWNAVSGASTYTVQLATDAGFAFIVAQQDLAGTSFDASDLDYSTTYHWRVRATGDGGTGAWSTARSFSTRPAPPAAPLLIAPADGMTDQPADLELAWTTVSGATGYTVQLSTAPDFVVLAAQQTTASTASSFTGLAYSTIYYWRVRAFGDGGDGPWSATRQFSTEEAPATPTPPSSPTLSAPATNSTQVPVADTLTWNTVRNAAAYAVQIAEDPAFSTVLVEQSGLATTTFPYGPLAYATTYYWRVRAVGEAGESDWSTAWSFTTGTEPPAPPAAPNPLSPAQDATDQPTAPDLAWDAVPEASVYQIQLATDAGFASILLQQSLTETSFSARGLELGTVYYWRVRAENAAGWGSWSTVRQFTTRHTPPAPSSPEQPALVAPADQQTGVALPVALTWRSALHTTSYEIQLSRQADFSTVTEAIQTDTTFVMEDVSYTTRYYWRVRGLGPGGTGSWSAVRSFTTAAPAAPSRPDVPALTAPEADATEQALALTLVWNVVLQASSYDVQLATDAGFDNLTLQRTGLTTTSLPVSGLQASTGYYWRVRASGPGGTSSWSDARRFTTRALPPEAPHRPDPADAATDQPIRLLLQWDAVDAATSYSVQLSTKPGFGTITREADDLSEPAFNVDSLAYETTYYWRVRASGEGGSSGWSTVWAFTTATREQLLPAVPEPAAPQEDATNTSTALTLAWRAASGATSYAVQVATDAEFSTLVVERSSLPDTSLAISGLAYGITHYWRIRAANTNGTSPWSEPRRFTTKQTPPPSTAPLLASPTDQASDVATVLEFNWNPVAGAASYSLQLSKRADFSTVVAQQSNLDRASFLIIGLTHATTYYWRIKANNAGGTGPWSDAYAFTTVDAFKAPRPVAPVLLAPVDGALDIPTQTDVSWRSVTGATSYRVDVSVDSTFASQTTTYDNRTTPSAVFRDLKTSTTYYWRVRAHGSDGDSPWSMTFSFTTATWVATEADHVLPDEVMLLPNYPNPFNNNTVITIRLPAPQSVRLDVFDALGRQVATLVNAHLSAGTHHVVWEGRGLSNGSYFYRLQAEDVRITRRMVLLR